MYSHHGDSIISLVLPFVYLFSPCIIILYKKIGLVGAGTFCATNHCFYQGNFTFELEIQSTVKILFHFTIAALLVFL